jgi:hypothetical protein
MMNKILMSSTIQMPFKWWAVKRRLKVNLKRLGLLHSHVTTSKASSVLYDSAEDPMAEEYKALEYSNSTACDFLDVFGYNGSLLLAKNDRKQPRVAEQQTLARPPISDREKALAVAVTHNEKEQKAMTAHVSVVFLAG